MIPLPEKAFGAMFGSLGQGTYLLVTACEAVRLAEQFAAFGVARHLNLRGGFQASRYRGEATKV